MTTATRTNPLSYLTDQLNELKAKGTHFKLRVLEDEQAPVCTFDGKKVINLASNNYLGLTTHPKLREAALEATRKFGVGSGAVRTIAGTMKIHMELEEKIARFKNVEACVVFQSGFAANAGTVSAVLGKDDFIISDALNHASIIDGARLSKAKILVFRHKDIAHAEEQLASIKNEPGKKLLITDGVFSMDGDIGPLPALVRSGRKIRRHHDGRRRARFRRAGPQRPRHDRSFRHARARGYPGGNAVEGHRRAGRIRLRHARSDRFSLSPRAAVSVLDVASAVGGGDAASRPSTFWRTSPSAWRNSGRTRASGRKNSACSASTSAAAPRRPARLRSRRSSSATASSPWTSRASCSKKACWAPASRFPTVPEGKARIRTIMTATHTKEELEQALEVLKRVGKRMGILAA